jgi:hypothetical protein
MNHPDVATNQLPAPPPQFVIDWVDGKRDAQMPARDGYPNGMDVVFAPPHVESCSLPLPYPAPRCGFYSVTCNVCGTSVCLTTGGRADDPRSVTMACAARGKCP